VSEAPAATTVHRGLPRGPVLVLLLTLATLLPRLAELPTAREGRMPPDAAHFLNVARCFSRGQGFSNPAAWPAWMKPDRLPMPETFKEPGYPFLIALLSRTGFTPFRAGLALSLIAGLLLPFAILALGRQVHPDPAVGFVAALIAAGSPLLVDKSVTVIVESLFALAITLLFLSAALGVRGPSREARPLALDVLTGALFGAAWLLRAQTLLALPALLLLFVQGRSWRRVAPRLLAAALAAGLVLSPFIARNLRLFGVPFYSDVPAFGIWPYVDHVTFSNGLARPPAPLGYALAHPLAILRHALWSAWHFGASALPRELYGDPLWALACAVGLVLGVRRWREQGFAFAYVGLTVAFILCVHWDTYRARAADRAAGRPRARADGSARGRDRPAGQGRGFRARRDRGGAARGAVPACPAGPRRGGDGRAHVLLGLVPGSTRGARGRRRLDVLPRTRAHARGALGRAPRIGDSRPRGALPGRAAARGARAGPRGCGARRARLPGRGPRGHPRRGPPGPALRGARLDAARAPGAAPAIGRFATRLEARESCRGSRDADRLFGFP